MSATGWLKLLYAIFSLVDRINRSVSPQHFSIFKLIVLIFMACNFHSHHFHLCRFPDAEEHLFWWKSSKSYCSPPAQLHTDKYFFKCAGKEEQHSTNISQQTQLPNSKWIVLLLCVSWMCSLPNWLLKFSFTDKSDLCLPLLSSAPHQLWY